jgi:PKD repeat protein
LNTGHASAERFLFYFCRTQTIFYIRMKNCCRHITLLLLFWLIAAGAHAANPQIHAVTPLSTTVARYEKFELLVDLTATYNSPYDFSQVNLSATFTSPGGQQYLVDGFYMQDFIMSQPDVLVPEGSPGWRIRFSPNQSGTWTYTVKITDMQGSYTHTSQQFTTTSTSRKGFVTRDGDHLVYSNGDRFLAIGTNLAWTEWGSGFTIYGDWLDELKNNGANFVKVTLSPWIFGFEWGAGGLGNYTGRQNRAWALDWVFDKLQQHRIYCQLHFLVHDELVPGVSPGWEHNPYNAANGGPCNSLQEFLSNPVAKSFYKQKIRYINARWGYSAYLQSWEVMSEADNTPLYSSHYQQNLDWVIEMTEYIKSLDNRNRPVSSGYAWPQNDPNYWDHNAVDYTQSHIYDFIPDLEMKIYNYTQWFLEKFNKPTIVGEFALAHSPTPINQQDPDGITFHNVLWSSVMSGAIGSAMSWWWNNYLYPNGLFSHFQPVSTFVNQVNMKDTQWEHYMPLTTSNIHGTLDVFPDFSSTSKKAPSNTFHIGPSGSIAPTVMDLSRHLYGSLYNAQRNPPTFHVHFVKPGQFKVRTGSPVLFSKIRIRLNGITIINTSASANSTYTIDVPAGMHTIAVENSGNGIMRVEKYIFENYMPELRTFAKRKNNQIAGWFQNRNYNWEYLLNNGTPPPVQGGKIRLDDLDPGLYRVRWFNQNSGIDSTQFLFTQNGQLILDAPPVVWSGAFEAKFHAPFNIDFTASPQAGLGPLAVQFTDQTQFTGGGNYSWMWTFGDGSFSFQQNPLRTYSNPGTYTVKLQVSSGQHTHSVTKTNFIVVEAPVVADFVAEATVVVKGNPLQFIDLSQGSPASYLWNFGDNTYSFQANPLKTYNQPGIYTVSLLAQKGTQSSTKVKENYIQVLAPLIGDFSASLLVALPGDEITFNDQSVGVPNSWSWDFGNGATSNQQHPITAYNQPGSYTVTLTVTNAYQQYTITKPGYINILAPLNADFSADTTFAWTGQTVTFTDLSTGNPETWFWDYGDGQTSQEQHPQHVYTQEGHYTISLTVTDIHQTSTKTKTDYLYVREPLSADFFADTTVVLSGQTVQFTDQSAGFPQSWNWMFGDGTTSTQQHPDKIYQSPGLYTINLRVSRDGELSSKQKQNYIEVLPLLEAAFEADTLVAVVDELIQLSDLTTGNPTSWHWDLGNYSTTVVQHPTVFYSEPGVYTIKLDVANDYQSDSLIKQDYITILEPLAANFSASSQVVKIGKDVLLSDLSTGNPGSWVWSVGDSIVSTDQFAALSFLQPGYKDITLKVSNQYLTDSLTQTEYIYVQPPTYSQNITLRPGWSGISSFVQPLFPAIETIFSSVSADVVFAFNEQGIYWPAMNMNTIGLWDTSKGLIINMLTEKTLVIEGYDLAPNQLPLTEGWNLLPLVIQCEQTANSVEDAVPGLISMIKEIAGIELSWPEYEIFTLDTLQPGRSYFIHINQDTLFTFPACDK